MQACLSVSWLEISRLITDFFFLVGHIVYKLTISELTYLYPGMYHTQAWLSFIWSEISGRNSDGRIV